MMLTTFQKELEIDSGVKFKFKINDNRSTMLSVKWEPDCTRVSLHRMFLEAPRNVMEALACYLRREDKNIAPTVRAYIEDSLKKIDYSQETKRLKLYSQGNVYNLQQIYDTVNKEYFGNELMLRITWYGKPMPRCRSRVVFGLYDDPLKLIKVNRILDSPAYPDYLVSYIVYHEMVHHVCPPYFDQKGVHKVHTKEFKEMEEKFRYFQMAQDWIKQNQSVFFVDYC